MILDRCEIDASRGGRRGLSPISDRTEAPLTENFSGGAVTRVGVRGSTGCHYSLCKELFTPNPIAISRCRRRRAVRPIVLLSVSGEERTKDHPNWPRRWRTAALDVLAERSRRSRPSVQRRVLRRLGLLRRRSCFAQARAATALSAACWAAARAPEPLHPARKSTRCARAQATNLSSPGGRRRARSAIQVAADACAARQNASSCVHARLCMMSLYMRDYAQRVRASADVVGKTLSLVVSNNSLQREYYVGNGSTKPLPC